MCPAAYGGGLFRVSRAFYYSLSVRGSRRTHHSTISVSPSRSLRFTASSRAVRCVRYPVPAPVQVPRARRLPRQEPGVVYAPLARTCALGLASVPLPLFLRASLVQGNRARRLARLHRPRRGAHSRETRSHASRDVVGVAALCRASQEAWPAVKGSSRLGCW